MTKLTVNELRDLLKDAPDNALVLYEDEIDGIRIATSIHFGHARTDASGSWADFTSSKGATGFGKVDDPRAVPAILIK